MLSDSLTRRYCVRACVCAHVRGCRPLTEMPAKLSAPASCSFDVGPSGFGDLVLESQPSPLSQGGKKKKKTLSLLAPLAGSVLKKKSIKVII